MSMTGSNDVRRPGPRMRHLHHVLQGLYLPRNRQARGRLVPALRAGQGLRDPRRSSQSVPGVLLSLDDGRDNAAGVAAGSGEIRADGLPARTAGSMARSIPARRPPGAGRPITTAAGDGAGRCSAERRHLIMFVGEEATLVMPEEAVPLGRMTAEDNFRIDQVFGPKARPGARPGSERAGPRRWTRRLPPHYFPGQFRPEHSGMAERTGILRCALLAAGMCLCFVAPSLADPAQTAIPATMRRLPSAKAHDRAAHSRQRRDRRLQLRRRLVLWLLAQSLRLHSGARGRGRAAGRRRWALRRSPSPLPSSSARRSDGAAPMSGQLGLTAGAAGRAFGAAPARPYPCAPSAPICRPDPSF